MKGVNLASLILRLGFVGFMFSRPQLSRRQMIGMTVYLCVTLLIAILGVMGAGTVGAAAYKVLMILDLIICAIACLMLVFGALLIWGLSSGTGAATTLKVLGLGLLSLSFSVVDGLNLAKSREKTWFRMGVVS